MENIALYITVALLFLFFRNYNKDKAELFVKVWKVFGCGAAVFALSSVLYASNSFALFEQLTEKGSEIFLGMRDIIYVVAGFGIIGVAVGGFFGNLNWKWLGAIIIGLMIIAVTAAFINYVVGEDVVKIQDTLK